MNVMKVISATGPDPALAQRSHIRWFFGAYYRNPYQESGANRGRLRGNGEPGWRAFDGVGEAGVPAAELVGEVVVEHTGADLKE